MKKYYITYIRLENVMGKIKAKFSVQLDDNIEYYYLPIISDTHSEITSIHDMLTAEQIRNARRMIEEAIYAIHYEVVVSDN